MNILVIQFEAGCSPLWYEGEDGELYQADLDDDYVWSLLNPLDEDYQRICFDEDGDFHPHGFNSEEEMKSFNARLVEAFFAIREYLKDKYNVLIAGFFDDWHSINQTRVPPVL